jgi:hypothetical protein
VAVGIALGDAPFLVLNLVLSLALDGHLAALGPR